uniref:Uncharacterized protein n=1 Tax=Arundo donax TaxID=35708 RepID=A0A0A9AHA2_ARUDO
MWTRTRSHFRARRSQRSGQ